MVLWLANGVTVMDLSTEHENTMVNFIDKQNCSKQKPLPIIKYNAFMSGVDRADQMMVYYPIERKTVRWYKKLFVHVLHMILLNSHALYNMYRPKMSFYDFRLAVIEGLLPGPIQDGESLAAKRMRHLSHKITKITERDGNNRTKRKKCRLCCQRGKKNVKTGYHCNQCPDKPGLCLDECFQRYHDLL